MTKITMVDVAKKAGVSKSTVSQFLNKRYEYMGEETRRKIEEAIKELEYQPNYLARSLKQKRTSMIGIIVANIMHHLSTEVSRAIEDFFIQHDIHAILCNADNDPKKERKYIEMLRSKQVDGLIVFPTEQNVDLYKHLAETGYPIVFMDRKVEGIPIPSVKVNNSEATQSIVEHLVSNGHRRISMVTQPLTISTRVERIQGYKKAIRKLGIDVNENLIICANTNEVNGKLREQFSTNEPPTALVAGNDLIFLQILEFAKENKLQIGKDFSLAVFDNIPFAHLVTPAVTTIAQPSYNMGEKAAKMLLKLIKKEETKLEDVIFDCQLLIRDSSNNVIEE